MTDSPSPSRTADDLRARIVGLPLERRIRLLSGAASFALAEEPALGLAPIILSDGPTGVRGPVVVGGRRSCLLPCATLIAQTWDERAQDLAGQVLAEEARLQATHLVLGPTINLHRSPLGGRLFEAFSEDPYLTGRLAAAYVRALQSRGIGASAKHFLANESETERTSVDAVIDEATLREVYLQPFEIVVRDANPWTVMAAYNQVNGTPSTEHRELISEVLKGEWGYDGVVVSDWHATGTSVESARAGLDLVMPGPDTPWSRRLAADVAAGRVEESVLEDKLVRLLRLAGRVGALDPANAPAATDGIPTPDAPERRAQLRELAASGMVVLKNEGGTLPLDPSDPGRMVAIGRHVLDTIAQGGGSARVHAPHEVPIAEGLRERFGAEVAVVDGVETREVLPVASPHAVRHPVTGAAGIRVRVLDAAGRVLHDRHLEVAELEDSMSGWLEGAARIELSAGIAVDAPQDLRLGVRGPGTWRLQGPGIDTTVRIPYHHGPGGGFFRPRSHAESVRVSPGDVLTATVERDEMARILGLVVSPPRRSPAAVISAAVRAATGAGTAVVAVGLTPDQETEGQDKRTLALPGEQDALVTAVAGVARRTVVVVNAATPVLMPWADQVDAILLAGLPGQEAGHAVAAALAGDVLPEGRLVTTFPAADGAGPAWSTTPTAGRLVYAEGPRIGYRGWAEGPDAPAFWFGHGLGLTRWEYGEAELDAAPGEDPAGVAAVRVRVRNVGEHDGIETVQVYLDPDATDRPVRLIGWTRVALSPGEEEVVTVACDPRMQRRWDADAHGWRPLGAGTVLIARGLGDVRGRLRTDLVDPAPRTEV